MRNDSVIGGIWRIWVLLTFSIFFLNIVSGTSNVEKEIIWLKLFMCFIKQIHRKFPMINNDQSEFKEKFCWNSEL